ncbi:MMPL family transporter [Pasteurella sp. PK-2025]|uniref:MMPL family transporter n=1 Tax=Pasteurella sp. PK-2025 TaxID=3413133 RepID=UPI003C75C4EE
MNKTRFLHNNALRVALWLAVIMIASLWLIVLLPKLKIENNLTALLQGQSEVPPHIERQLAHQLNRSILWLVGSETLEKAMQGATQLQQHLQQIPQLEAIEGQKLAQQQAWQHYFFTHRSQLLSAKLQQQLQQPEQYFQSILAQLYSPMSGISTKELQHDPLLLTRNTLLQTKRTPLQWQDGWLYVQSAGKYYVLLQAKLKAEHDNLKEKSEIISTLKQAEQQVKQHYPNLELDSRSALYFSDYAAKSVEQDIKIIGIGSAFGILLLMFFVFRSLMPLLLLLFSLATGIVWGTLAIWCIFGEIHLLTIALSASLVGVSADYSLHFLSERYFHQPPEKSEHTLTKLRPTLLFAFITTALAYSVLGFAPLIILKQMAVYAVFGLAGALFTIFTLYPFFTQKNSSLRFPYGQHLHRYLQAWQHQSWLTWLIASLVFISLCLLPQLKINDDVRLLQAQPTHLQQIEQKFDRILQQHSQLQYFIVQSTQEETLLTRLEQLFNSLNRSNRIQPMLVFSDYLPSQHSQAKNHQLVQHALQQLQQPFQSLGIKDNVYSYSPISLSQFLSHPIGQNFASFFFQDGNQYYALIPLKQSEDKLATEIAQQHEGVSYHNTTQDWSRLFEQSRDHILIILASSLMIVTGLLSYQFSLNAALRMMTVIATAMLLALTTLVLTGQYFNLFSSLALILILGMGLDYGIFLLKNRHFLSSSFIAVILSALTTQLSFGLLMLSQTTALVSFATVLCVGISTAFMLSPWVLRATDSDK